MNKCNVILFLVFLGFYSCKQDLNSIKLDKNQIVMHYNEGMQLDVTYSPADLDVPPALLWSSENTNVASVNGEGYLEGVRVGETKVVVKTTDGKFEDSCKVIIEPISNLFNEPIYKLGYSIDFIKNYEKRELILDEPNALLYSDENTNVRYIVYSFENEDLKNVSVYLKEGSAEEAILYLTERYEPYSSTDKVKFFKVSEKISARLTQDSILGLTVTYMKNN